MFTFGRNPFQTIIFSHFYIDPTFSAALSAKKNTMRKIRDILRC